MSEKHPIIAVTGSSGAGTSSVKTAFEHIFFREKVTAAVIEGDSYHRYERAEIKEVMEAEAEKGNFNFSHFGPMANDFESLEKVFINYGTTGTGDRRYYIHNEEECDALNERLGTNLEPGQFTPFEPLPKESDLLFYEGLHGGVVCAECNVAQWVDLLIGVVPIVNLEWIQKIHRDKNTRGYSEEAIVDTILRRMHDYVKYITPQFSRTDINFQRVPLVDTSNPFIASDIPTADESYVIIRFRDPKKLNTNFPYLLSMIHDSFMSRRNDIVVPGGKMGFAIELLLTPIIHELIEKSQNLKQI